MTSAPTHAAVLAKPLAAAAAAAPFFSVGHSLRAAGGILLFAIGAVSSLQPRGSFDGRRSAAAFWSDFCRQCGAGNPGAQTAGEKAQLGIEAGNIRKNRKKDRRKSVDAGIQGNPL